MLDEVPIVLGQASPGKRLCPETPERLAALNIKAEAAEDPLTGEPAAWIAEDGWQAAEGAGLGLLDPLDCALRHLQRILTRNLTMFLGHQEIAALLRASRLDATSSLLTGGRLELLIEALRGLVAEEVSIGALDDLCAVFLKQAPPERLDQIIEGMRRLDSVRPRLPGNQPGFTLILAGPRLSQLIKRGVVERDGYTVLAIEPEPCQAALSAVRTAVASVSRPALVVNDASIRIHLRKLVELEFPDMPVLASDELEGPAALDPARSVDLEK
jgi:flagellar biosynthesis component FlhA